MKSKVKSDFHTLYSFYSAVDHHHRYCHNRCWSPPLSSYFPIMLLLVIVATGIKPGFQIVVAVAGIVSVA